TSVGRKGDAALAQSSHFSAYLIKPLQWIELHDAIVQIMRDPHEVGELPLITRHSLAEARRGRVRILLVEDNPVNQLVTDWALKRHGYNLQTVKTAKEALEAYEQHRFDLVLMDIQMPDMDGYRA